MLTVMSLLVNVFPQPSLAESIQFTSESLVLEICFSGGASSFFGAFFALTLVFISGLFGGGSMTTACSPPPGLSAYNVAKYNNPKNLST